MKKTYNIEVDCANCANKMEDAAKKTEGVLNATVNFMLLKMTVEFAEGADEKEVMKQDEIVPFLQMLLSRNVVHDTVTNEYTTNYPQFDYTMQEFNVNVDQFCIFTLLRLQSEILTKFRAIENGINIFKFLIYGFDYF